MQAAIDKENVTGAEERTADEIAAAYLSSNSRTQYSGKNARLVKYLVDNYPELCPAKADGSYDDSCIILPLSLPALSGYMGSVMYRVKANVRTMNTASTPSGYRSALMSLYTDQNIEVPKEQTNFLRKFFKGYNNTTANERNEGRMNSQVGKDVITTNAFKNLIRLAYEKTREPQQLIFFPQYCILEWNIMCRQSNVGYLRLSHITWYNDALLCYVHKHKGDNAGEECSTHPRHIYANSDDPLVCAVLGLGLLLLSISARPSDPADFDRIFSGGKTEARFGTWLRTTLRSLSEGDQMELD